MEKQVETELKLELAPESWPALVAAPLVRDKVKPGSGQLLYLISTYYDTKDWSLRRAGMAYRVRQTGDAAFEATVKMDQGVVRDGLSERKEITVPLPDARPVVREFTAAGLELSNLIQTASLQPLFTVTVARQVQLLQLDRETVAELALDRGEVRAGQQAAPIGELELELKTGSLKTLLAYAIALAAQFKLMTGLQSKYEQGLRLLGEKTHNQKPGQLAGPALQKLLESL